jgi:hypothetical protein
MYLASEIRRRPIATNHNRQCAVVRVFNTGQSKRTGTRCCHAGRDIGADDCEIWQRNVVI